MIPNATDRKVSGNLQGDKVAMTFDEHSLAHIMSILTDLYSDPELAVIREYSTNALDSHIEAGISDPIEVTLPTALSPYLKIRDHGVGLSVDDIHEIYSKYGASTKRGSNDATGMLGVGCKAALTYSAQFTLVAVKDGVRVTVAVSRDEDGAGSMTIVDTSRTTDRNGVEVSIPAKGGNQLESKAQKFFRFWKSGTVLVNGKAPTPIEGLQVTPEILLVKRDSSSRYYGDNESHVVMGNVPYPAGELLDSQSLGIPYQYSIIVQLPIGSVDFAPSREQLQFTKRTKTYLAEVAKDFKNGLFAAVQAEIEQAETRADALKALHSWSKLIPSASRPTFRHRGKEIKTSMVRLEGRKPNGDPYRLLVTSNSSYSLSSASNISVIDLDYLAQALFITNYTPVKLTPTHKKKMQQWIGKQDFDSNTFVLIDFPADFTWIDSKRVVQWDTINAEVLPRKATTSASGGRLSGSYDILVKDAISVSANRGIKCRTEYEVPADKINFKSPVYWAHGSVSNVLWTEGEALDNLKDAFSIICLPKNRIDKFRRDNPTIQEASSAIQAELDKWMKSLTDERKLAIRIQSDYYIKQKFDRLANAAHKILDPDVQAAARAAKLNIDADLSKLRNFRRSRVGNPFEMNWDDPLDKYLLFDSTYLQESIEYMNWKYNG